MDPTVTITTERNPRDGAGGDLGNSDVGARPALRGTDEYTAAFDIEVWKAQQQAQFRAHLRHAKEKLKKKIYEEMMLGDQRQIDELARTREELEQMALRLEAGGEALQKRHAQLEQREAAFEARRVKVSEQHEAHLARVEQRAKRATEEVAVAEETLAAQLREKDLTITQLRERLRCAENEYDILRRRTARLLTDAAETGDGALVREAEEGRAKAERTARLLQGQLRDQTERVDRLNDERDVLLQRDHEQRMRIHALERELAQLANHRYLSSRTRERATGVRDGLVQAPRSVLQGRERRSQGSSPAAVGGAAPPGDDLLLRMLRELKNEVVEHANQGGHGLGAVRGPAVMVEKRAHAPLLHAPPPSSSAQGKEPRLTTADPYVLAEEIGGQRAPTAQPLHYSSRGSNPAATVQDAGRPGQPSSEQQPQGPDTSVGSTASYRRVEVEVRSWHSSDKDSDGEASGHTREERDTEGDDGEPRPEATRPPLAPVVLGRASQKAAASRRVGCEAEGVSPSPEDFAQAAAVSANDAATTRVEMEGFVRQMKLNREKLLETGVYSITHPVVKEMTDKIALYEQYLSQY